MLSLYRQVTVEAARRAIAAWPVALSLVVYAVIVVAAVIAFAPLGIIGGLLVGFVVAACWSSYLELLSQAVAGAKIRIRWDDFKRTFMVRFWDVISVMFAFWIISFVTGPFVRGPNGPAAAAIIGFAIAFFFNAVPELLYQGSSRSFALLLDSARFMFRFPVVWLLPNVLFAALGLVRQRQARRATPGRAVDPVRRHLLLADGRRRDLHRPPRLGPADRAVRAALRDDLPRHPVPRAGLGRRQRPLARLPGQNAQLRRATEMRS